VTRKGLRQTSHVGWDEITDYRLTIELTGTFATVPFGFDPDLAELEELVNVLHGIEGARTYRMGIALHGGAVPVVFDWRFRDEQLAIAHVIATVHPRLTAAARARLSATGSIAFGPMALTSAAIDWYGHAPIASVDVEKVELFDDTPVSLRVMKRGEVWPYAKTELANVPNVVTALQLARDLGYVVHGLELLEALVVTPRARTF